MMGSSDLQNWTVSWGRISASLLEYYLLCFCYYQIARKMSREPILLQQFGARYFLQGYEVDTQNFCQLIGFYEENRDKQWGVLCVYEIAVEGPAHVNVIREESTLTFKSSVKLYSELRKQKSI